MPSVVGRGERDTQRGRMTLNLIMCVDCHMIQACACNEVMGQQLQRLARHGVQVQVQVQVQAIAGGAGGQAQRGSCEQAPRGCSRLLVISYWLAPPKQLDPRATGKNVRTPSPRVGPEPRARAAGEEEKTVHRAAGKWGTTERRGKGGHRAGKEGKGQVLSQKKEGPTKLESAGL